MQEAFKKIKERLETELNLANEDRERYLHGNSKQYEFCKAVGHGNGIAVAIEIVNQVAEEFATDINVGNSWKIIYDKVLELEKEYAMSGAIENVNDCIRLENLLQYFKEELREENNQFLTEINQSLTNADKIRSMTDEELAEFLFKYSNCEYCCISEKCTKLSENSCIDTFLAWLQQEVEE